MRPVIVLGMRLSASRQRNAVSEGAALGLVMCDTFEVPAETWRVSLAFEGAWRAWDITFKESFSQVSTDLRQGLNGYIAMTHAGEQKHVMNLFWAREGGQLRVYAREWCSGEAFDADEVAASVDGDVPAAGWEALARDFLSVSTVDETCGRTGRRRSSTATWSRAEKQDHGPDPDALRTRAPLVSAPVTLHRTYTRAPQRPGRTTTEGGRMARRGFFAEMQHQAAVAERDRQRAHAAAIRAAEKRQREAERARAAAERARAAAKRADTKARAEAEREAKRLHIAAQEAHVEALNGDLQAQLSDIDDVLTWTLSFDDHVDLEELRREAEHPPFSSPHEAPLPAPAPISAPPEPQFTEPPAPTGLGAMFAKKKHAAAVEEARTQFAQRHAAWQEQAAAVPMRQLDQMNRHQTKEAQRTAALAADRAAYDEQCQQRQLEVDAHNAELENLIARLASGEKAAVEEYFSIVWGNSVYPDVVSIDVEHSYKPDDKELEIGMRLPDPASIPTVRSYKYVKAKDEVAETSQTAKEQRERYNQFVLNVVLRTLHEVWESDRAGHVETVSLTAGVDHIDPATGRSKTTPLVAVAAHRGEFEELDLAHVTPAETLKHLKAAVSKNPHALAPIDLGSGVRG